MPLSPFCYYLRTSTRFPIKAHSHFPATSIFLIDPSNLKDTSVLRIILHQHPPSSMKEPTSDKSQHTDRTNSWIRSKPANHPSKQINSNQIPISNPSTLEPTQSNSQHGASAMSASPGGTMPTPPVPGGADTTEDGCCGTPMPGTSLQPEKPGPVLGEAGDGKHPHEDSQPQRETGIKDSIPSRILRTIKFVLFHSKLNLLLVFVPIGIAVEQVPGISPGIIFGMNAVAIIPLAGLLSFATEAVARKLGDSLGALLNITFGNAVELIIFIALVKVRITASLLGSILANLLLILGMSFFLGGLRFREQIYNSTVTQMSACLLSLSVISLVLPTAFHASFNDSNLADAQSLKISRGTSVILLLVYIIYLLFQLLSHSYMYESTPQHIIDEEATPGPVANWLDSSSSESSSSSDSDSSDSDSSRETVGKRMRRAIKRHRKSSIISVDTSEGHSTTRTRTPTRSPSFGTTSEGQPSEETARNRISKPGTGVFEAHEDAIEDEKPPRHRKRDRYRRHKKHRKHHKHRKSRRNGSQEFMDQPIDEEAAVGIKAPLSPGEPRRVDFAMSQLTPNVEGMSEVVQTRSSPFQGLRGTLRPVARSLAPTVFTSPTDFSMPAVPSGPVPRVRYGIRRTNSLPDRLNQFGRPPGAMMPSQIPLAAVPNGAVADAEENVEELSRRSAVILLLVSTALVAVCAEFMVDSINGLVKTSSIGEIFIGLIILPIVGNAAEHVTAITVAMKNKMDLAIGVAVGSSIQIALFITPLIVIIGWIMDKPMTLYFTLFETVCLFVSAFITNFLVLDGRSNYLEGALLLATYVIISVVAFFYPNAEDTSAWGT
uniref:Vacuolar calcium ion transporter n=1 Tax=Podospora anserina (strain S / ATCC MYA-4624 / DSM 980 / FGSC 10383) TaxID=515849 RepID=A0A090C8A9_PODAN|nr:Putative vacuolar calcium ion transporter [Podospora anserina S mat+]